MDKQQPTVLITSTPDGRGPSSEKLKKAFDMAGIDAKIVVIEDEERKAQYWAENALHETTPLLFTEGLPKPVERVSIPAIELPKVKQVHIGARARKRWNAIQDRSSRAPVEIKHIQFPRSALQRIQNKIAERRALREAKRERFLARFRVPTKRKRLDRHQ